MKQSDKCGSVRNDYIYIIYIYKVTQSKQYQNNGTENLFLVITYLTEVLKMRLLLIAKSFFNHQKEAIQLSNDWANSENMNQWLICQSRGTLEHFQN